MARTDEEIIGAIATIRIKNRALYKSMEDLIGWRDQTLEVVALAYHVNPKKARHLHNMILENDEQIMKLSKELVGCE